MKELLLVAIFLASAYAKADVRVSQKEALLKKNENLQELVKQLRVEVKGDDTKAACVSIEKIFLAYQDYTLFAGQKMEAKKNRKHKRIVEVDGSSWYRIDMEGSKRRHRLVVKNAVEELAYFDHLNDVCKSGKNQQYLDVDDLRDNLKDVKKSLKKQRRKIKRDDVDENNGFSANYSKASVIFKQTVDAEVEEKDEE